MSRVDVAPATWPVMKADLSQPVMWVNGEPTPINGPDRMAGIVAVAAYWAQTWKRPIRVTVTTPGGDQVLVVDEDGNPELEALVPKEQQKRGWRPGRSAKATSAPPMMPSPLGGGVGVPSPAMIPPPARLAPPAAPERLAPPEALGDNAFEVTSELPVVGSWPVTPPDAGGFGDLDGMFDRSAAGEVSRRHDPKDAVARQFTRTHFVTVMGAKGGPGKTTTAALVAAAFGMWSGERVALIDNNPTGSLAARLEKSRPGQATIIDVARDLDTVGEAASGLWLQSYMTYQPSGKFSSLVARTTPVQRGRDGQARLVEATLPYTTFQTLMALARQVFRVVVLDGGNNDADSQHMGALSIADCVLLVTDWSGPACKAVAIQLATLRELGRDDLISSAIVIGSGTPATKERKRNQKTLLAACANQNVPVMLVPRVPSLSDGPVILAHQPSFVQKAVAELACAIADRFEATERWA